MQPTTGVFEKYFTREEEKTLFAACRKQKGDMHALRDYWTMKLMRYSGGRVSSICGLTVGDALSAIAHQDLRFTTAKGGRPYSVAVHKNVRMALLVLLRIRLRMGLRNDDPKAPLLAGRGGRHMTTRNLQLRVEIWRKAAGIQAGTPHFFRHTMGRRMVDESTAQTTDKALLLVQGALGHRSFNTTAIYAAPGREELRQAVEGQA